MEKVSLPVPSPRKLLSTKQPLKQMKKPVPLPRTNLKANEMSAGSPLNFASKQMDSLTRRLKSASENVDEKRKAMVESTKNVSSRIEKSVKNILNKRQSAISRLQTTENSDDDNHSDKSDKCQSLPAEDIFRSISFLSPLDTNKKFQHDGLNLNLSDAPDSLPPPDHPPPPLPDQLYDEVQSNYSGSFRHSLEGSSFEDSIQYSLSICEDSESDFSVENERKESAITKSAKRSESWSFYETMPIVPSSNRNYENVIINPKKYVDNIYIKSPVPSNFSSCNSSSNELADSVCSEEKRHGCLDSCTSSSSASNDRPDSENSEDKNSERSHSLVSSVSISNELYDTWEPRKPSVLKQKNGLVKRPSKSVIFEFDPLYENIAVQSRKTSFSQSESNFESLSSDDAGSLPEIPKRLDSIAACTSDVNSCEPTMTGYEKDENPLHDSTGTPELSETESCSEATGKRKTNLVRWSSMKRAIKAVTDSSNWAGTGIRRAKPIKTGNAPCSDSKKLEKPPVGTVWTSLHSGQLLKSASGGEKSKDFVKKNYTLSEGKLFHGPEKNSGAKDFISLESVLSVQLVTDRKQSASGEDVFCFEMTVSKNRSYLFGALSTTERRVWMQKIVDSFTSSSIPISYSVDYLRVGWCYLKQGVSSDWISAWILLSKRTLVYTWGKGSLCEVDLRKARGIKLQDNVEGMDNLTLTELGPAFLIDTQIQSIYFVMDNPTETNAWKHAIRTAAVDNGPHLADQQLTKDDVPTIVDKCINFIYAHGSLSEGIYRRSGGSTNITKLLAQFRQDAWAVQLSRQEYSEYDVASVLKRFFRDLPEPLLSNQLHKYLCTTTGVNCSTEEKISVYRSLLEQLEPVNYVTTRRLISHLHSIHLQQERNLMPAENLAAIWGPTLMHVESNEMSEWVKKESEVICDLINLYPQLFLVDCKELDRERKMMEILERYHDSPHHTSKPSGDLKVWIYINKKDTGSCVNITLEPTKDSNAICTQLADRTGLRPEQLCLLEVICDGSLTRPLHHSEKVLDVVLRWGYWDEVDRRENYLIITKNELFQDIIPLAKPPLTMCGDLRFADTKSKSFKSYLFEFSQAKLCYYKDKRGSVKINDWRIEDIVWYIGYEPKRNPHTRWAITFIDKNKTKRTKENPFFGCTIAGLSKEEELKWIAALLLGEYAACNILPPSTLNLLQ